MAQTITAEPRQPLTGDAIKEPQWHAQQEDRVEIDQEIKELGDVPSADSLSADTAAGVGAGGTAAGGSFTRVHGRYTRCLTWRGGRAGSGSRAEKGPLTGRARAFVSEASLPR